MTDAGLQSLAALTKLRRLELHHNPGVTDAGLRHLERLTALTSIDLYKTRVTGAGAAALQKALPKTRVVGN